MKYVLDSNAALKWVLRESDSDKARQLRAEYQQQVHELLAPDVFPIEAAHALARSKRRGIITRAQGLIFHPQISDRPAEVRALRHGFRPVTIASRWFSGSPHDGSHQSRA
jgi:predicted nucleic acid-binding protein